MPAFVQPESGPEGWREDGATKRLPDAALVESTRTEGEETMAKFVVQSHGRLQEWVAEEHGYFRDEGLD